MIFAGELYDIAPAFEPLLCATHHAHDLAGFLAVEVRVVKGSLFTPPPSVLRWKAASFSASEMHSLQVLPYPPPFTLRKLVSGSSRPQTLHVFVSMLFLFLISKLGYLSLALPLLGEFSEYIEARHGDAEG